MPPVRAPITGGLPASLKLMGRTVPCRVEDKLTSPSGPVVVTHVGNMSAKKVCLAIL